MPSRSGNRYYRNVPSMYRNQYPMAIEAIYGSDYQASYGTHDTYGRGSASQSRGYTESSGYGGCTKSSQSHGDTKPSWSRGYKEPWSRGYTESLRPREDPEPRGDRSRNPHGSHGHPAGLYSLYGKRKSRRKHRGSRSHSRCIVM